MENVVSFPTKKPGELFGVTSDAAQRVADTEHNRTGREDQGPPIGTSAWTCLGCGSFAFYITPASFHCYECHAPQSFD